MDSRNTQEVAARTGAFLDVGDEAEDAWVSDMGMGVSAKMEALYVLRGVMSPQLASEHGVLGASS